MERPAPDTVIVRHHRRPAHRTSGLDAASAGIGADFRWLWGCSAAFRTGYEFIPAQFTAICMHFAQPGIRIFPSGGIFRGLCFPEETPTIRAVYIHSPSSCRQI